MCKEAKILLAVSALFTFAMGLSSIFINVFFWKQHNNFIIIVIYNLLHYITTPIAYTLSGVLAKRKNGIWSLRLGLIIYALFFGMILFAENRGVAYVYILGVVYGIATGFYWLAFSTLSFDFTCVDNRDTYNGFNGSCAGIAAAAAPITSAYIITSFSGGRGYNMVFTLTLSVFILLVFISLLLKCKNYGSGIDWKIALSRNCDDWSIIRKSATLWGIRDVTIIFVINILIIETTKSELSLGTLTLFASLMSSASYVLVQKIIKPPKRRLAIYIGTIGSFAAILGIGYKVTYLTLLIYVMFDAFFLPFFLIQMSSSTFNVINRLHHEDLRIEYLINKDIVLNAGRIISASMLIALLYIFKSNSILKVYLLLIGLAPIAAGYYLRKLKAVLEGSIIHKEK